MKNFVISVLLALMVCCFFATEASAQRAYAWASAWAGSSSIDGNAINNSIMASFPQPPLFGSQAAAATWVVQPGSNVATANVTVAKTRLFGRTSVYAYTQTVAVNRVQYVQPAAVVRTVPVTVIDPCVPAKKPQRLR